ncbi:MAG: ferric reductase-like transmembrane domain-containing protein [Saprospiraceae bacterium]|nr:ferric reductase-like transmembrane domain-containing protein [Saprospiraceae bacterium]
MGVEYAGVLWNKQKKQYDKIMAFAILWMVILFVVLHLVFQPDFTAETLIIRTSAFVAFTLLNFILIIGPLARLQPAFLPLLYNRRHLGVTMFFFAAIHGIFSIIQFHALGNINPIVSVFLSNTKYEAISEFPFQVLGFFALIILFLMAITSHDFWLKNLSPKFWKGLHMMVYLAYTLIVLHVATGILQYENNLLYWMLLIGSFGLVAGLHLASAWKERKWRKTQVYQLEKDNFFEVATVKEIPDNCGKGIWIADQNIAIFKYNNCLSAVNNVCRHQMGPLAEGQVVEGCITCPWHGYQYQPEDGQSPPPFHEKLETYQLAVLNGKIWVNPDPMPEGTYVAPIKITD